MDRRSFLMVTGGMVTVSGCMGESFNDEAEGGESSDEDGEATAEVVETDVFADQSSGTRERNWVQVDVENETTVDHGRVRIETTVLAEDGTELAADEHLTTYLPAETTLRYFHREEFELAAVDAIETEIVDAHSTVDSVALEDAVVSETSLSVGGDLINVVGNLELETTDLERAVVVAPLYDEAGRLRGTGTHIENNPAETFEFGANSAGFRAPSESDDIDSYDVLVFDDLP